MAWERLHVLARNPIPPASSDNSLSASFPPSPSCFSSSSFSARLRLRSRLLFLLQPAALPRTRSLRHPRLRRSYPGADPWSRPTYPQLPIRPMCCSRCHFRIYVRSLALFSPLFFVVLSLSLSCRVRRVAFSNFPYAPTNLRCARKRQGGRRLNVMPLISLAMRKLSGFGLNAP